jgi:hypothetical protein
MGESMWTCGVDMSLSSRGNCEEKCSRCIGLAKGARYGAQPPGASDGGGGGEGEEEEIERNGRDGCEGLAKTLDVTTAPRLIQATTMTSRSLSLLSHALEPQCCPLSGV